MLMSWYHNTEQQRHQREKKSLCHVKLIFTFPYKAIASHHPAVICIKTGQCRTIFQSHYKSLPWIQLFSHPKLTNRVFVFLIVSHSMVMGLKISKVLISPIFFFCIIFGLSLLFFECSFSACFLACILPIVWVQSYS